MKAKRRGQTFNIWYLISTLSVLSADASFLLTAFTHAVSEFKCWAQTWVQNWRTMLLFSYWAALSIETIQYLLDWKLPRTLSVNHRKGSITPDADIFHWLTDLSLPLFVFPLAHQHRLGFPLLKSWQTPAGKMLLACGIILESLCCSRSNLVRPRCLKKWTLLVYKPNGHIGAARLESRAFAADCSTVFN